MAAKAQVSDIDPIYTILFHFHWVVVLLAFVGPFVALGIGTLEFGHVPKASLNDPDSMSQLSEAIATNAFFISLLRLNRICGKRSVVTPIYSLHRWGARSACLLSGCFAAAILAAFGLYWIDPFGTFGWIMD